MKERNVKVGRYMIIPLMAQHWAVQVGDKWYEVYDPQVSGKTSAGMMKIKQSNGYAAESGAGKFGGNIVGKTTKRYDEINMWIRKFLRLHPTYYLTSENCQNFVLDMVIWLTNNNYKIDFMIEAANHSSVVTSSALVCDGFAASEDGNGIAAWTLAQLTATGNGVNSKVVVGQFGAQAIAGPGLGLFVDATLLDINATVGNYFGGHIGLNAKTGVGIRNGNLEGHLLGFGGKIGADGIELNIPIAGVKACSVM